MATPSSSHRTAAMLRVKVKSLGAEIRMIRTEEQRLKRAGRRRQAKAARGVAAAKLSRERATLHEDLSPRQGVQAVLAAPRAERDALPVDPVTNHYDTDVFGSLRRHRGGLSRSARVAHLAACAVRGTPYAQCETANARDLPDFREIVETALRFGGQVEPLTAWLSAAQEYVAARPHLMGSDFAGAHRALNPQPASPPPVKARVPALVR